MRSLSYTYMVIPREDLYAHLVILTLADIPGHQYNTGRCAPLGRCSSLAHVCK